MTIFCVNDYDSVATFTQLSPHPVNTLVSYAYQTANMSGMSLGTGIGQANAISILMSSALVLVAVLLYRQTRKRGDDVAGDANTVGADGTVSSPRGRWWRLAAVVLITAVLLAPVGQYVVGARRYLFEFSAQFSPEELTLFWHSLLLASGTVIVCIALGAPAGYAVARGRGRAVSAFTVLVIAVQSFPVILLLFPMFWIFCVLGFINQLWTVQLMYIASTLGLSIWLFSAFLRGMPLELEEAAWTDGCSVIAAFFRVVLPGALPAVISVGFFVFLFAWGDLQIARTLLLTAPAGTTTFGAEDQGSLLFLLTPLVLFAVFNRRINLGGVTSAFARR